MTNCDEMRRRLRSDSSRCVRCVRVVAAASDARTQTHTNMRKNHPLPFLLTEQAFIRSTLVHSGKETFCRHIAIWLTTSLSEVSCVMAFATERKKHESVDIIVLTWSWRDMQNVARAHGARYDNEGLLKVLMMNSLTPGSFQTSRPAGCCLSSFCSLSKVSRTSVMPFIGSARRAFAWLAYLPGVAETVGGSVGCIESKSDEAPAFRSDLERYTRELELLLSADLLSLQPIGLEGEGRGWV